MSFHWSKIYQLHKMCCQFTKFFGSLIRMLYKQKKKTENGVTDSVIIFQQNFLRHKLLIKRIEAHCLEKNTKKNESLINYV